MLFEVGEFTWLLHLHLLDFGFLFVTLVCVVVLVSCVLHVHHVLLLVLTGPASGLVGLLECRNG